MWFDPGLAGLFITSALLHLEEDINSSVVSPIQCLDSNSWTITVQCLDSNSSGFKLKQFKYK